MRASADYFSGTLQSSQEALEAGVAKIISGPLFGGAVAALDSPKPKHHHQHALQPASQLWSAHFVMCCS